MLNRPMVVCGVFGLIFSAVLLVANHNIILCLLVVLAGVSAVCIFSHRWRRFVFVLVVLWVIVFRANTVITQKVQPLEDFYRRAVTVTGQIDGISKTEYGNSYTMSVTSSENILPKHVTLKLYGNIPGAKAGNIVKADVLISAPEEDKRSYYLSNSIYATGEITQVHSVSNGRNIVSFLAGVNSFITDTLFSNLSYEAAALVNAITVGNREYQDDVFTLQVRNSGVSHIMVVSGLHMAVFCGSAFSLFKFIFSSKRIASLLQIFVVIFIMALCGFTPSVLRAGITYIIIAVGSFFFRRSDGLNSLCVAVTIMLIQNPFCVGNISFQLSVASVAGILIFHPALIRVLNIRKIKSKLLSGIISAALVTVAALIFTLPVTIYNFGQISLVSVITNLLISYAVTLLLCFSAVGLLFAASKLQFFANICFNAVEILCSYIFKVINYFGTLPFAAVEVNKNFAAVALIFAVAICALIKYTERRKFIGGEEYGGEL